MNKLTNKLSYFAVSLIMGTIIVAFLFTGYEGFNGNVGQVASVGGTPISSADYKKALQFNIDQYSRMLQGKGLTSQQIKQFRLKEMTLQNLISQKHMLNFANELSFNAGKKYIKNEIKEYKAFQTGDKFDISKYKQLLKINNFTPAKFEAQIIDQIKSKKLGQVLMSIQDSKSFLQNYNHYQSLKMNAVVVSIDKENMTKNLDVDNKLVTELIKDSKKKPLLESLYKTYVSEFKAKNPKKKEKTFAQMEKELAIKHLQKVDRKGLTAFHGKLTKDVETLLSQNDIAKLKKLAKKYDFTVEENFELPIMNLSYKGVDFKNEELVKMYKSKDTSNIVTAETAITKNILKAKSYSNKIEKDFDLKKQIDFSKQKNARTAQNEVLKHQQENTKVVTSPNLL